MTIKIYIYLNEDLHCHLKIEELWNMSMKSDQEYENKNYIFFPLFKEIRKIK